MGTTKGAPERDYLIHFILRNQIKYGTTIDVETTIEIGRDDRYYKLYIGDIGRNTPIN